MGKKKKKKEKGKEKSKKKKTIGIIQETCEKENCLKKKKMKKKKKKKDKKEKDVQENAKGSEEIVIFPSKRKNSEMEPKQSELTGIYINQGTNNKQKRVNFEKEDDSEENDSDIRKIKFVTDNDSINNTKVEDIYKKLKRIKEDECLSDSFESADVSKMHDKRHRCLERSNLTGSKEKENQFHKDTEKEKGKFTKNRITEENCKEIYECVKGDEPKKVEGQEVKVEDKFRSDRRIIQLGSSRSDEKYGIYDSESENDCDRWTRKVKGQDSKVKDNLVKKNHWSALISSHKKRREEVDSDIDENVSPRKSSVERNDSKFKDKEKKKITKHKGKHSKRKKCDEKTKSRKEEKIHTTHSRKTLEGESKEKITSSKIMEEKYKNELSNFTESKKNKKLKSTIEIVYEKDGKFLKMNTESKDEKNIQNSSVGCKRSSPHQNSKKREWRGKRAQSSVDSLNQEPNSCSDEKRSMNKEKENQKINSSSTQDENNRKRKYKLESSSDEEVTNKIIKRKRSRSYVDDIKTVDKSPKSVKIQNSNDICLNSEKRGKQEGQTQMGKYETNCDDDDSEVKEKENILKRNENESRVPQGNKEDLMVPEYQSRKCAEKFVDDTTYREQWKYVKVKQGYKENMNLKRNRSNITMETDNSALGVLKDSTRFVITSDNGLLDDKRYDSKWRREEKMQEKDQKNVTNVSSSNKEDAGIDDEVSKNLQNREVDEEKSIYKVGRGDNSPRNSQKFEKESNSDSTSGDSSVVKSGKEFKIVSLKKQKHVFSSMQDNYNSCTGKLEKSVKNSKDVERKDKIDQGNGNGENVSGKIEKSNSSLKHLCDNDFQTKTENDVINKTTKKVKSVISIVSIPASTSNLFSSAERMNANFKDEKSPNCCRSRSVRKIMHEELLNMKRPLTSDLENSRENGIQTVIEKSVLGNHENRDLKSLYEDLSDEDIDNEEILNSRCRENNSCECDDRKKNCEKMSEHGCPTTATDESQTKSIKAKERESIFDIDIDSIMRKVSKKEDIFREEKKQRQYKTDKRISESGSRRRRSGSEASGESLFSAKENIRETKLESAERNMSRESKSPSIDIREKDKTGFTSNKDDKKIKSVDYLKDRGIRKTSKKRRNEKDYYDEKYYLEKKKRKRSENVEKRRTRSRSLEKCIGEEMGSRDQDYKKKCSSSKEREFTRNRDVNEKKKRDRFEIQGLYSDRFEEYKKDDNRNSGSPLRVEDNKNFNALYTPDISKNMNFCSLQDDREKKISTSVTSQPLQSPSSDLNRNENRRYSSSSYSTYSRNTDKYHSSSTANRSFDYPSSKSSSFHLNRRYDCYSSPMFARSQFNPPFERYSNRGINSTIGSTPDKPRFIIPSYKELTGHENEVEEDYSNDKKEDFELFWRIQSPFSQFHPARFEVRGVWYSCAEQFFMHQKALTFDDKDIAAAIMNTNVPREQKSLGRKIVNFCPKIWFAKAISVAREGNIAKFSQNEHLKKQLFDTYPKILAEASPVDSTWGIGLAKDNQLAWSRKTWRGQNFLGYTLTDVRNELMRKEGLIPDEKKRND